ncbi:MAG: bifunctional folylpolyglutamate synthase/dihydrofolate synthase [Chlorobi bacterium]|nr:bifunctional folylpolyglutamate synthase/dihydrofolate synthase [Chlorobiota bacterium]MCI0717072.1 bifunctional folylpolyglutamate synthase/dihydrofolate synthase [Chlorobiota bacterium]
MKNINKYFNYLYRLERIGIKYDLRNITQILKSLGNPHHKFKSIHIAGTNGKGATASFIASILMEHSFKVGLFTSPHILRFNERIRINGKCIDNGYIKDFLNRNIKLIEKIKPSFFEVNTAIAFQYFSEKNVDIAVIECGMGGRLDSTNVLRPEVSVITQIGIDHTRYLGNTLEKIALEKLGIVKNGVDVIVSDKNKKIKRLFENKIDNKNFLYIDSLIKLKELNQYDCGINFTIHFKQTGESYNFSAPLLGEYQPRNAAAALLACTSFAQKNGHTLYYPSVLRGIKNVKQNSGYKGRIEIIKHKGRKYIFDISHNAESIGQTYKALKGIKIDLIVFGIMSDKDYKKCVPEVLKHSGNVIFTKPNYERALEPKILQTLAKKSAGGKNLFVTSDLKETVRLLNEFKGAETILFIGSFFLVSDAIKAIKLQKYFR